MSTTEPHRWPYENWIPEGMVAFSIQPDEQNAEWRDGDQVKIGATVYLVAGVTDQTINLVRKDRA